jgi:hypothetical protein
VFDSPTMEFGTMVRRRADPLPPERAEVHTGRNTIVNGGDMRAVAGDHLHFQGKVVGLHEHAAVVIEVRGADGAPPYLVRHADGHEAVVFPGPDAWVEHMSEQGPSAG